MKSRARRQFQHIALGLLLSAVALSAHAQVVQNLGAQPATPPAAAPVAVALPVPASPAGGQPAATSTMVELQQLIQGRALNELRTTYNGNYGASLLFKPDTLTYYVALFQQKNFWRVVKTTSEAQAEQTYRSFVDQTAQLADVDIRRIRLDAERAAAEKQIAASEARLSVLQDDLAAQRQQEEQVAARQEQMRQEASALAADRQAASDRLAVLERQVRTLQDIQDKVNGVAVPAPAPAPKRVRRSTAK